MNHQAYRIMCTPTLFIRGHVLPAGFNTSQSFGRNDLRRRGSTGRTFSIRLPMSESQRGCFMKVGVALTGTPRRVAGDDDLGSLLGCRDGGSIPPALPLSPLRRHILLWLDQYPLRLDSLITAPHRPSVGPIFRSPRQTLRLVWVRSESNCGPRFGSLVPGFTN